MKKPILTITILISIILILSVVKIFVSNRIATSGVFLGKIEEEINSYKTQNAQLSEKIYTLSSLTNVSQKALQLGYIDQKTDFVLNTQVPVAFKQ